MKKIKLLIAATLPIVVFFSCNRAKGPDPQSEGTAYLDLPSKVYPYFEGGTSLDSFNHRATLGRVLFYDRQLSINNSVSCGSCHKQAFAFSDNAARSAGFENRLTDRNTPALQNLGFSGFNPGPFGQGFGEGTLFWDGRERDMEKLITRPIANHVEMGIDRLEDLPAKLGALPYYKDLFQRAYGSSDITVEKIARAVALFVTSIKSINTRFDQDMQQGGAKLSALELEGKLLFEQKYDCTGCHNENIHGYMSSSFKNIGLDAPYEDRGLGAITNQPGDNGRFKVPNLRNVVLTAPYMHDGRFQTLDQVLDHYSHGIKADANLDTALKVAATGAPLRMNISKHEKEAIIAFLGSLTDVDMITNPYYSDPFKIK